MLCLCGTSFKKKNDKVSLRSSLGLVVFPLTAESSSGEHETLLRHLQQRLLPQHIYGEAFIRHHLPLGEGVGGREMQLKQTKAFLLKDLCRFLYPGSCYPIAAVAVL